MFSISNNRFNIVNCSLLYILNIKNKKNRTNLSSHKLVQMGAVKYGRGQFNNRRE